MRNYNSKSFVKPMTQNSFKKSDRKYPDPKKVQESTVIQQASQKESKQFKQMRTVPLPPAQQYGLGNLPSGSYFQTYFLLLQNPYPITDRNSTTTTIDSTCLWYKNIQTPPTKNSLEIKFKATEYIIGEWVNDTYPHVIFVTMDGIWGFMNENGQSTNRVMAMKLREIQPYVSSQGLTVYELRYSSTCQTCWQIPGGLTHIKLGMKMDENDVPIELPLPNPIVIEFEIK